MWLSFTIRTSTHQHKKCGASSSVCERSCVEAEFIQFPPASGLTYSPSIRIVLNRWPPTAWCIVSFISRCEHPVYPFSTSHIYLPKPELHPILCGCSLVYVVHFSNVVWHAAAKNGKSPIWFWFEVHIWFGLTVGLWLSNSFLECFNIAEKK